MESIALLFVTIIACVFAVSYIIVRLDDKRIRAHIASIGGELLGYEAARERGPWAGIPRVRVYGVKYRDKDQKIHHLLAKMDHLDGAYFAEDTVISGDVDLKAIRADLHRKWIGRSTPDGSNPEP